MQLEAEQQGKDLKENFSVESPSLSYTSMVNWQPPPVSHFKSQAKWHKFYLPVSPEFTLTELLLVNEPVYLKSQILLSPLDSLASLNLLNIRECL